MNNKAASADKMSSVKSDNFTSAVPHNYSNVARAEEDREEDYIDEDNNKDNSIPLKPRRITERLLEEIRRELCLINLCWPAVNVKRDVFLSSLPSSYFTVSKKESLLMWYADNFRRQFRTICPDRKPLLMACENECGIQKFVSTTIRRSTLPYSELYTWQGCANFVSDYISYEPPGKALVMPSHLRTPTWLKTFQRGNSFECATFLVSLLLGQGYNAYVVSGYASYEQVKCDLTRRPYPYIPQQKQSPTVSQPEVPWKYHIKPPPNLESQFLIDMERRERQKIQIEQQQQEKEREKMIRELERPPPDPYWGQRVHAWVVILPELNSIRQETITEPLFIEPSSGLSYDLTDQQTELLYLGVESIWNDQNYWVNMQSCSKGCSEINWDLTNVKLWEHLLPGEPWTMQGVRDQGADVETITRQDKHLDMPASYVDKIYIDSLAYKRRYPNGKKCTLYKKAKVESFSPYVQPDGLIQRITTFDDYECITPIQVYEKFSQRADLLIATWKNIDTESITDFYKRGRADACKEHRYVSCETDEEGERVIDFYNSVRLDGLSKIVIHPLYLTQHYIGREDLLYYRHIEFHPENTTKLKEDAFNRYVWKIIEKYHRNNDIPADKDIEIREFAIGENEIRLMYHYEKGRATRSTRTFIKPSVADRGDNLVFNADMIKEYIANPMQQPEKSLHLYNELKKQLDDEDQCLSCVRDTEREISTFLHTRAIESANVNLTMPIFDISGELKEEMSTLPSQRKLDTDINFLEPYLARVGNATHISEDEACRMQQDCLNDFKSLLVKRANNILQQSEEYRKELERLQAKLTADDVPQKEKQNIRNDIDHIQLALTTLEVRLKRHQELASIRYQTMVDNLQQNKQLDLQ